MITNDSTVETRGVRAILTYHSVDHSGSVISIDPVTFAEHVSFLSSGTVKVLSVADLLSYQGSHDAVAITFDDGFANFADLAWPLLREQGLPATVFVVPDRVGKDNRWNDRADPGAPTLPLLTWERVGQLIEDGASVGSHSRTHPRLDRLGDRSLLDEIIGSADDVESYTGCRPTSFCYPFGSFDDASVAAVRHHYALAFTTRYGLLGTSPDPHLLPRLDCFYFREPGALERRWGRRWFATRVRTRAVARATRTRLSSRRVR